MRRLLLAPLALAALCSVPGCKSDPSAIVVAIHTDGVIPGDFDTLELRALRVGEERFAQRYDLSSNASLPATLTFYDSDNKALDDKLVVVARALRKGETAPRVTRTARLPFVEGRTKLLRLSLDRSCIGVSCADGTTCSRGSCTPDDVDPAQLPDFVSNADAFVPPMALPQGGAAGASSGGGQGGAGSPGEGGASGAPAAGGAPQGGAGQGGSVQGGAQQGGAGQGGSVQGGAQQGGAQQGGAGQGGAGQGGAGQGGSAQGGAGQGGAGQGGDGGAAGQGGSAGSSGQALAYLDLAAGDGAVCTVDAAGTPLCWGKGNHLLRDVDVQPFVDVPEPLPGYSGVSSISMSTHSCAVVAGKVRCWGDSNNGEVGPTPNADIPTLDNVTAVLALSAASCALVPGTGVSCWGRGDLLGQGPSAPDEPLPKLVPGTAQASRLVGHDEYVACALHDGLATCWGAPLPSPVDLGLDDVLDVTVIYQRIFALRKGGVVTYFDPAQGALGSPVDVPELAGARLLDGGGSTLCASLDGASVVCGDGSHPGTFTPIPGFSMVPLVKLVVASTGDYGFDVACSLDESSTIRCWGNDRDGEVGIARSANRWAPDKLSGVDATFLQAAIDSSAAVRVDGSISAWGRSRAFAVDSPTPTPVSWPNAASRVAVGAWGDIDAYVLDTSSIPRFITRGSIKGPTEMLASQGAFIDLVVTPTVHVGAQPGSLVTFVAQTGPAPLSAKGNTSLTAPGYVSAPLPAGVTDIASSWSLGCVVTSTGQLSCWGSDSGDTTGLATSPILDPTPVTTPGFVQAACVNDVNICVVLASGDVHCRGNNTDGLLGSQTPTPSWNQIPTITGAQGICCSLTYACAWSSDGSASCWGRNRHGVLARGKTPDVVLDPAPALLTNVASISCGELHACARHNDDSVSCWGANHHGALGNGVSGYYQAAQTVLTAP